MKMSNPFDNYVPPKRRVAQSIFTSEQSEVEHYISSIEELLESKTFRNDHRIETLQDLRTQSILIETQLRTILKTILFLLKVEQEREEKSNPFNKLGASVRKSSRRRRSGGKRKAHRRYTSGSETSRTKSTRRRSKSTRRR
jgi:hypothetical protein